MAEEASPRFSRRGCAVAEDRVDGRHVVCRNGEGGKPTESRNASGGDEGQEIGTLLVGDPRGSLRNADANVGAPNGNPIVGAVGGGVDKS